MRQQLNRIISDKKSIGMIIFMLVIPILDIVQIYYQDIIMCNGEIGKPYPLYVTFLSCYSQGHIFQMIYLWFLSFLILVPSHTFVTSSSSLIYETNANHPFVAAGA